MTWQALDEGKYDDLWKQNQKPVLRVHNRKSCYWFRVTLKLQAPQALPHAPQFD